jgi:hypothetical protein
MPDDFITRQELAMLVKELQEKLNLFERLAATLGYEYSLDARDWVKKEVLAEFRQTVKQK